MASANPQKRGLRSMAMLHATWFLAQEPADRMRVANRRSLCALEAP
jgi:hypothetical protein